MISSLSFLYLRSWLGVSEPVECSLLWMSCSCRRRSRLNSLAMVSKVSSTFGLSSASIAASDMEFSRSSSSRSDSGICASSPPSSPAAAAGLKGVAAGGAEGGDTACSGCAAPLPAGAPGPGADGSEERRVGKSVDLGGRRIIKKKKKKDKKKLTSQLMIKRNKFLEIHKYT